MTTPVRIARPPFWAPNPVTLIAGAAIVQIAGSRPNRDAFVIANDSAGNDVFVSPVADQSQPVWTVAPGGVLTLEVAGEIYAWSVAGSELQTLETFFPPDEGGGRADMPSYAHALGKPS